MTPAKILYSKEVSPCYLEDRTYLHGTTVLTFFFDGICEIFDLAQRNQALLKKFRILQENHRQGKVVVIEGKTVIPNIEEKTIHAEMAFDIDCNAYLALYVMNDLPLSCRVPYDESAMLGEYEIDRAFRRIAFQRKRSSSFQDWIRTVVAGNKVFCQELFGKQKYRWVSLTNTDLLGVHSLLSGREYSLEFRHADFRGGIGGKNYVDNMGWIRLAGESINFEIRYCY